MTLARRTNQPECSHATLRRRAFLRSATAALVGGASFGRTESPRARVLDRRWIPTDPDVYYGWPTLLRRRNGELMLVCSGGREAHICPFGRVELLQSRDEGRTWTWPRVLLDSAIDDRDAGILETSAGTLLVTTFTSLAYEPALRAALAVPPGAPGGWPAERLARWRAAHERADENERRRDLGTWMIRSTDGGATWSARYDSLVNSPHGPIELADGRLLYAGKQLWSQPPRIGVAESLDDGRTWHWLAEIPARPGDDPARYHELHAAESRPGGRIVVQIRNHNRANDREILQTESEDGGRSWTPPRPIGVWGLPPHLMRLADGRLLLSYGHRRPPYGVQARLSADEGRTWSDAIVISDDGAGGDLGYPSTVQMPDGRLLTAWYELPAGRERAGLRLAEWTIAD